MVEARRVRLDSLEVEEPRRPASPPHPRRERLEPREKRPTPRVLLARARANAGVHVQRAALRQQHRHRHRPARLGAGDEAEVDPVGHARQRGGRLHVVARMHRAPPLDAVRRDVAREGGESILVPLASVHVRRAGMDEVREGEVADAGVQVNHRLAGAREAAHARLLGAVAGAEHRATHVEPVQDAILLETHPAAGTRRPHQARAALAVQRLLHLPDPALHTQPRRTSLCCERGKERLSRGGSERRQSLCRPRPGLKHPSWGKEGNVAELLPLRGQRLHGEEARCVRTRQPR
mmetsp:Transcript_44614/g.143917  ORF Transcript_44614/g.143917 Transcript_44614/m.143917 type:complete len:292 (-) Transcript_44614:332-1207(-)